MSVLVEWDAEIPPFEEVFDEVLRVRDSGASESRDRGVEVSVSTEPLRAAQRWFLTAISHGASLEEGVELAVREHLGTAGRLDASRHAGTADVGRRRGSHDLPSARYRARLVECLADDYGALQDSLGHETFEALAPRMSSLSRRGRSGSEFLRRHMADFCHARNETWHDFAADLATLEWADREGDPHPEDPPAFADEAQAR